MILKPYLFTHKHKPCAVRNCENNPSHRKYCQAHKCAANGCELDRIEFDLCCSLHSTKQEQKASDILCNRFRLNRHATMLEIHLLKQVELLSKDMAELQQKLK